MNSRSALERIAFLDLLMGLVVFFSSQYQLAALTAREATVEAQNDCNVKLGGVYLVRLTWDDGSSSDIDLHVRDPENGIVYYNATDVGLMGISPDDRGTSTDTQMVDGRPVTVRHNEESVTLRGTIPGEYVVNLQAYLLQGDTPKATVSLVPLRHPGPALKEVEVQLTYTGQEITAFRFTVNAFGDIVDFNTLQTKFVTVRASTGGQ